MALNYPLAMPPVALTDTTNVSIDASHGNLFTLTIAASRTINVPTNPVSGQIVRIAVTQGGFGSYTLTWTGGAGGFRFPSGVPKLSTAIGAIDYLTFCYNLADDCWDCTGFAGAINSVRTLAVSNGSNANLVTIQGGVTSADYSLTLPTAQGSANAYLKNDGSGNLSWDVPTFGVTGAGVTGALTKWTTGGSVLGDSVITEASGIITIAGSTPSAPSSGQIKAGNGKLIAADTLAAGGGIQLSSTGEITMPGTDADTNILVNYTGYNGGVTRARSLSIYDGKNNALATFNGPNKTSTFYGSAPLGTSSGGSMVTGDGMIQMAGGSGGSMVLQPSSGGNLLANNAYYNGSNNVAIATGPVSLMNMSGGYTYFYNKLSVTAGATVTGLAFQINPDSTTTFLGAAVGTPSAGEVLIGNGTIKTYGDVSIGGNASIRGVTYVWPAANAAGIMTNDGSGNLSWASTAAASLTSTYIGFGSASNLLTGSSSLTWNDTTKAFLIAQGTKTAAATAFKITSEWNNAAVDFTAFDITVTRTAQSQLSRLMKVGAAGFTPVLAVRDGGIKIQPSGTAITGYDAFYQGALYVTLDSENLTMPGGQEHCNVRFGFSHNIQFTSTPLAQYYAFSLPSAPSYSATAPATITNAATVYIGGAPTASTNVTITNAYSLLVAGGVSGFAAPTTSYASVRLPHGTAPTNPVDGDVWTTSSGMYVRVNGVTVGPLTAVFTPSLTSTYVGYGSAGNALTGSADFTFTSGTSTLQLGTASSSTGKLALANASTAYLVTLQADTTTPASYTLTFPAALPGSTGFLKSTSGGVLSWDTSTYLTGNQTITLSSDVTGSGTTSITATIASGAVTLAKMANLAANSIIGNNTASPATPIALTATQVKTLLTISSSDVSGLTAWATKTYPTDAAGLLRNNGSGTLSWDTATYLTANQTITLSGDVSGSGTTAITTAIGSNKVTLGMMAQVATGTILGRVTASTGNVEALTGTQATSLLDTFSTSATTKGLVPGSNGVGATYFLRADGTWAVPADVSATLTATYVGYGSAGNALTGSADFTFASGTSTLQLGTASTSTGKLAFANASSAFLVTLQPTTTTPASYSLTFPAALPGSTGFLKSSNAGVLSWDTSTYLTANQTITLSGDVSGSGTTAITTSIGSNKVTLGMMAQVATGTFLGRVTASTGNVEALTGTQATSLLDTFSTSATTKGLVPGSNSVGATYFLCADGTWAVPPGGAAALTATYIGYGSAGNTLTGSSSLTWTSGTSTLTVAGIINQTSTSGLTTIQAATQDGVRLLGRAGGTSSYIATITPTTLTASRTITLPDADGTVMLGTGVAGRVAYYSAAQVLTSDSNFTFGSGKLGVNYIQLNTAASVPAQVAGLIYWDPTDSALSYYNDITGSSLQIGFENWIRVVNKTGGTLTDGTVVIVSGAQGNRPTAAAANATLDSSHSTIGVVTADIADNAEGNVTTFGLVHGFNTSSFTAGDVLYVDPASPGQLTNVRPTAPNHAVRVGYALNSTNNGLLLVSTHVGESLADLHDATITTPVAGNYLRHNGTKWVNATISSGDVSGLTAWATKAYPADAAGLLRNNGSGTLSWDTSTYLTANQTITLSGDVTGSGTTAITTAIGSNKVTLGMMAQVATATILGRVTAATGNVEALTGTQATSLLDTFSTSTTTKGLVPGSNGVGTTYFLRADGTWAVPSGGTIGGSIASTQVAYGSGADTIAGSADFTFTAGSATLQLGTVSTKTGNLALANASSSQLVTLQAGNTTASYSLTLPTATSLTTTSGQVMTSIGGAGLQWGDRHYHQGFDIETGNRNAASTISFVPGTGVFTLTAVGATLRIWKNGVCYDITTKTVTIPNTGGTPTTPGMYFITFDGSGLVASTSPWDVYSDIPVATVYYYSSTLFAMNDERHNAVRNRSWHYWGHTTVGTRYASGLAGTFTNTTLSMTTGVLEDEDIIFSTGGTVTTCRLWRYDGTRMVPTNGSTTTPYLVNAGTLQYDNAGTPTNVTNNNYVVNDVWGTTDPNSPIWVRVGTAQYGTLSAAQAALGTTSSWQNFAVQELKLLYQVIYRNAGGTPTFISATDYRTAGNLPGGAGALAYVGGAGTVGTIPKWSTGTSLSNSIIEDFGTYILVDPTNLASVPALPTGTALNVASGSGNANVSRLLVDTFTGTGGGNAAFAGRSARGTNAAPTATGSGDEITHLSAWGYGATGYSSAPRGLISIFAAEAWTDSAQGTRIGFHTTAPGTTTTTEKVRIWGDGGMQVGGTFTASSGAGVVMAAAGVEVGVSSSATGTVLFRNSTNANTVTLQAGVTSASYSMTLPTAAPGSTAFLKSTSGGVLSWDTSTYLTANQSITLSGDVSGTGTTAITTTIGSNKVTLGMMAQVATATILGRVTAATGNVEALTGTQATSLLDTFSTSATTKGLVPGSNGVGSTYFLRADGTWAVPPDTSAALTATYIGFGSAGDVLTGSSSLTWNDTNKTMTLAQGTITAASKPLDITSTWNNAAVAFTGMTLNVTNTASLSTSYLFRFQSSGNDIISARIGGGIYISQVSQAGVTPSSLLYVEGQPHTTLPTVEWNAVYYKLARTYQFSGASGLAVQRAFYIDAPTYSATVGTKTITDSATVAISGSPIAGTNVALTNAYALWVQSGQTRFDQGTITTAQTGLTFSTTWNDAGTTFRGLNIDLTNTASQQASRIFNIDIGGIAAFYIRGNGSIYSNPAAETGTTPNPALNVSVPGHQAMTAGTEYTGVSFGSSSMQFASNTTVATQRFFHINAPTYTFASAGGTITSAATLSIGNAPIAGTNATITNGYALWVQAGKTRLAGNLEIAGSAPGSVTASETAIGGGVIRTAGNTYVGGSILSVRGVDYTFPAAGAAGKLTNDGAGNVSWSNGPVVFTLTDAATISVNAALGAMATVTLGGSRTMGNPTNPVNGQTLLFRITQSTGSHTITWDTAYAFSTALPAPTLSTAAGAVDYVGFVYSSGSSKWHCVSYQLGFA